MLSQRFKNSMGSEIQRKQLALNKLHHQVTELTNEIAAMKKMLQDDLADAPELSIETADAPPSISHKVK